jgi:hypothetical protein
VCWRKVQHGHQGRQVVAAHVALLVLIQVVEPLVQTLHPDADLVIAVELVERQGDGGEVTRGFMAAVAMLLGEMPQALGLDHGLRIVVLAHGAPQQAVVMLGKRAAAQSLVVQLGGLVVAVHEAVLDGQVVAEHGVHMQVAILEAALASRPEMLEAGETSS